MKVAFISQFDSRDVKNWSGTPYFMAHAMERAGLMLDMVGPLCERALAPYRFRKLLRRKLGMKAYLWDRDPQVLRMLAGAAAARLGDASVAFSPGTAPIAFVKCPQPIVFWTDMTFAASLDFYMPRAEVSRQSLRDGTAMEQAALDRAAIAIYSSEWARAGALANYKVDPAKVKVIPFGANVSWDFDAAEVEGFIASRSREVCRLVFVGVDWLRKGGPLALEIASLLNKWGVRTELTIVGCTPPVALPQFVAVQSFIDKAVPADLATFANILKTAHFLVLPTLADCTPMVIAEAASAGVPCAASDVGGIGSQIRDGVNGRMFPLGTDAEVWADWLGNAFADGQTYEALARAAYAEYATRLNWDAGIRAFKSALAEQHLV